jgi:hypothetical protein
MSAGLNSATSSAANCHSCQATANTQELPYILSACLLSMEAEPNLRLFTSSSGSMETASSVAKTKGSTKNVIQPSPLDDPSITHLVVFPISPEIDPQQPVRVLLELKG